MVSFCETKYNNAIRAYNPFSKYKYVISFAFVALLNGYNCV